MLIRHDAKHDDFTRQKERVKCNYKSAALTKNYHQADRQVGIQTALLVSNPWSSDKCPTVHPFKDGLLDLDALCLLYWISSSALIHQGLLCYILKSNLGAALDTKRKFPKRFIISNEKDMAHCLKLCKNVSSLNSNFGAKNDDYDFWYFFSNCNFLWIW